MTFVQLEYIVALDTFRHFAGAAEACFVTQPTLSMQIQKLESELGIKIFDRSKQPVIPTEAGIALIEQARKILSEKNVIEEIVQEKKGMLSGELRIGVIPTVAPYLLPLFIKNFNEKYPHIRLIVKEVMTTYLLEKLREGSIDVGILATPLHENGIKEHILFYEELVAYVSKKSTLYKKTFLNPNDIVQEQVWIMQEGHCFRSQILHLCDLQENNNLNQSFTYEAGNIETLKKMVDINGGITIIPELAMHDLHEHQLELVRHFKTPAPMREISIVVHRDFVKKRLIEALKAEIIAAIPDKIKVNKKKNILPI